MDAEHAAEPAQTQSWALYKQLPELIKLYYAKIFDVLVRKTFFL